MPATDSVVDSIRFRQGALPHMTYRHRAWPAETPVLLCFIPLSAFTTHLFTDGEEDCLDSPLIFK